MFNIGDRVRWRSDAKEPAPGERYVKEGTVLAIVPAGASPYRIAERLTGELDFHPLISGGGGPRNHESYLVGVETKSGRGKARVYWPRVKWLRAAS